MPRKNPLPRREQDIARRLVEARAKFRCSRADLAELADVDAQELTRVELGRTSLRYGLATQIISYLELNPRWLATGEGDFRLRITIPNAVNLGISDSALFVDVYDNILSSVLTPKLTSKSAKWPALPGKLAEDSQGRHVAISSLRHLIKRWFVEVPDSSINELFETLQQTGEKLMAKYPKEDLLVLMQRYVDLNALDHSANPSPDTTEKSTLDSSSPNSKSGDVTDLDKLIERVRTLSQRHGAKTELAKFLGVAPARISEWLAEKKSDRKEPGGHYALQLLKWVEQQERQK